MKKVWILNHYALEPSCAGGTRHYSFARYLQSHDWQATIIASSVNFISGQQRLKPNEAHRLEKFEEVKFLWVKTSQYKGNGIGRMRNMLSYTLRVLLPSTTAQLDKPDLIIGSSVHPFAAWSGAILASRFKVPFVFEVRDLWPQTLIDMGRLSENGLFTKTLRFLEKWLYTRADKIVVLLPKAEEYIAQLGISTDKVTWIPNGVDLDNYPEPCQPSLDDKFTLMYLGAHGQANGLDCLLQAMAELKKSPAMTKIVLRLIGDGPLKPVLKQQAKELNLTNVRFEDAVPKREVPAVALDADAFVILVRDLPKLYRYGISMNKIFDYFASARPIVIASSAANNPVMEAGAGLTVLPETPTLLAKAIENLAGLSQAERKSMGEAGRRFVIERHGFDKLTIQLASVLDELVVSK